MLAVVPAASAASTPKCPKTNGNGNAYPPGQCMKLQVGSSTITPGGDLALTGTGFHAGEPVSITLHSTPVHLATVDANDAGAVQVVVVIPTSTPTGTHTVAMHGLTFGEQVSASIQVTNPPTTVHSGSNLPFSGASAVMPLSTAGASLVLAGGLTLVTIRRRRRPVAAR